MPPRVVIILLSYNHSELTQACLDSLLKIDYPAYEILVVDNGSTDGAAEEIRGRYPQVGFIQNETNLGFVGGNNIGLRYAQSVEADYALLLNNDTEVAADFLSRLVSAAEADASVGVAGPTIYYYDRPNVVWSAGGAIDWRRGSTRMVGLDETDRGQFGMEVRPMDFVTGCALLVKMAAVKQAGTLDERFFAYYEETEWCVRIARAGYKIVHVPLSKVWHKISPASRAASPSVHYYMTRNRLLFLRLSGAGWQAWAHTVFGEYLRTLLSWSLKPQWKGQAPQRKAMLMGIKDYLTGHQGRVPW